MGGGKGTLKQELVLTPFGFREIGSLGVGDKLCAVDGSVTHIIGYFERGENDIYRCHLSDGTYLDVDQDHIWYGWRSNRSRKICNERTNGENSARKYSMQELLAFVGESRRFAIPVPEPVAFNVCGQLRGKSNFVRRDLDSYVLGVLLGDGSITQNTNFCSADEQIVDRVRTRLPDGWGLTPHAKQDALCQTYGITSDGDAKRFLSEIGVHGHGAETKFIPRIYLLGSVEERWELLRGLMDTDGWAEDDGDIYFCTISRQLALDVRELAWSLGGVVTIREKNPTYSHNGEKRNGKLAYTLRLKFRDNSLAFALERKKARCGREPRSMARYIERIEHIGRAETVCIQVAHPSSLYIAKDYIVTHNSDFLLGDFAQDVPGPWGAHWHGILFRRTYPELEQLIGRSQEIYPAWFPKVKWSESKTTWTWPNGAELKMRYLESSTDWMRYWGHEYTWEGWDELGSWPDLTPYQKMKARLRSSAHVPNKRIRATGNPGGPAHHAIKQYFKIDEYPLGGRVFNAGGMTRLFVRSRLQDNQILMRSDPDYQHRLSGLGSPELVRAWLEGDWSVVAGAFFPEFSLDRHVIAPIELPAHWTRFVSADWGSYRPFAVHWMAVSDGELTHIPRGAIVVYREWYGEDPARPGQNLGVKMTSEEWGEGIKAKTKEKIDYYVVDPAAMAQNGGPSIAERSGIPWIPGDNRRVGKLGAMGGWDQVRARLVGEGDRPMLYIFSTCKDLIRTLPALQHDESRPEDVDTSGDDHCGDSLRYGLMSRPYMKDNPAPQPALYPIHRTINEMIEAQRRKRLSE